MGVELDATDGTVSACGCAIGPGTAKATLIAAGGTPEHYTNGYGWVRLVEPEGDATGPRWFIAVSYDPDERVNMVQLAHSDGPPGDWSDWSEDDELARRDRHDAWLGETLGEAWANAPAQAYDLASRGQVRDFPWGRVWSDYDTRSGGASITIRYAGSDTDPSPSADAPAEPGV